MKWRNKREALIGTLSLILGAILIYTGLMRVQQGVQLLNNATLLQFDQVNLGKQLLLSGKRFIRAGISAILLTQPESFIFYNYVATGQRPEKEWKLWIGGMFVALGVLGVISLALPI